MTTLNDDDMVTTPLGATATTGDAGQSDPTQVPSDADGSDAAGSDADSSDSAGSDADSSDTGDADQGDS